MGLRVLGPDGFPATRRQFLALAGAALAAGLGATACGDEGPMAPRGGGGGGGGGNPPPSTSEARIGLMGIGETVGIPSVGLGSQGIAVTRLTEISVVAVSRQCTHQGCTVALPSAPGATLNCPCHGSRFRVTGAVSNGPAATALRSYPARIVGNEVVVTLG